MNRRHNVAMVGGAAILLATAPLTLIFAGLFEWFLPIVFAVAIVVGTGMGLRTLRAPLLAVLGAQLVALGLFLTWTSASKGAVLGLIPTGATAGNFGELFSEAGKSAAESTIPVQDSPGLIFVAVLGVGVMAVLVDLFTMGLRTPALAGLPMLVLYVVPMTVMQEPVPWVLFIPGALGYLWLLLTDNIHRVRRFGRRFTGDGRNIDMWEPSPLASTGRWLSAVGIVLALLFPVIMPGINTAGLLDSFGTGTGGNGDGSSGGNGATRIDPMLQLRGDLNQSETTAMLQVTTNDPSPNYLRLYVLDTLTGDVIKPSDAPDQGAYPVAEGIAGPEYDPALTWQDYQAQVNVLSMNSSTLPLYAGTTSVDINRSWLYNPSTETVFSNSRNTEGLTYSFGFRRYNYTPDLLREAASTQSGTDFYELNTQVENVESVQQLADRLTEGMTNDYDRAMAINDHFSIENGFAYQKTTEKGSAATAIEDFLENKRGFCEQYAAAMVWLLRSAGVPARAVIGFTKGNPVNGSLVVTNFNAHAWVEVWFPGYGWVSFDPTPSSGVRGPVDTPWAPDPNRVDDETGNSNGGPSQDPNNPAGGPSGGPTDFLDPALGDTGAGAAGAGADKPPVWPYWLGGGVAALFLLATPSLNRASRRRRRLRAGEDPAEAAHQAWLELQDTLVDYDFPGGPSETPRGTADRLIARPKLTGAAADGVRFLASAEEQARYAAEPPPRQDLSSALKSVRAELGTHTGRGRGMWIRLAPPSVLRSWRQNVSRAVARTVNSVSRARMRLARKVSRGFRRA
ncbi:transglutaminase TgpA family protein [Phytomonospora endophytica]|uniref:Transglutaminase-like putative cysteine protease n=1 Tax=Phytomonospora endophytica TaxID=714109 RepID=A0A841FJC7_9ACTN|nr:DUF3488 and transglutaminase-like domain-containing protein [Phytomonospora endophytica]MBB6032749.1 transglutaminase-like putative cysteine protease [Phytomonospora endophytica]GIG66102.1 hypothetical protein Pen01_23970 [Phytomonospora endophytica]